jgi:hypothetical protein
MNYSDTPVVRAAEEARILERLEDLTLREYGGTPWWRVKKRKRAWEAWERACYRADMAQVAYQREMEKAKNPRLVVGHGRSW